MIAVLEDLLHDGAKKLDFLKQRHRQDASIPELVKLLLRCLSFHLKANMEHFWDPLLEVVHLRNKVPEVMRLLDLRVI